MKSHRPNFPLALQMTRLKCAPTGAVSTELSILPSSNIRSPATPLVRVHSECLTGDALGSLRCDCGMQLQEAIRLISQSDGGAVIYVRGHEGRGIGLANKIRAYALQDRGRDTVQANAELGFPDDARDYTIAVHILKALGIHQLTLLSNNPRKSDALAQHGLKVIKRQPLEIESNPFNATYLATKREKLGHLFSHQQG